MYFPTRSRGTESRPRGRCRQARVLHSGDSERVDRDSEAFGSDEKRASERIRLQGDRSASHFGNAALAALALAGAIGYTGNFIAARIRLAAGRSRTAPR
jgi:hypothetical protein